MAQLERSRRSTESPQTPRTSPTSHHLHIVEHEEYGTPTLSPGHGYDGEPSEDPNTAGHNKKSVLAKVKERAKKLKHTLSSKSRRHGNVNTTTPMPSGGFTSEDSDTFGDADDEFDEDIDEDPEYLGAPMYESEAAPENLKEHARQHPRAEPVVPESHKMPSENKTTLDEALSSGTTQKIASSITNLDVKTPELERPAISPTQTRNAAQNPHGVGSQHTRYESAVSDALKDAASPTITTGETSVVGMVKEAVYSVFGSQESLDALAKDAPAENLSSSTTTLPASENISISRQQNHYAPNANSAPLITFSDTIEEAVEEQNHGKILQTN
ncbi:uncharacterized protein LOC127253549 [Andrographis paniculata]|uniref:uncharacterized protein LOC127253549 n=1 Tax=Andrographis paniculata TaxID=175694 RepID=UPI0021E9A490|nr:uncharacterized protein LOC127253549 [Andrographis paniculata]